MEVILFVNNLVKTALSTASNSLLLIETDWPPKTFVWYFLYISICLPVCKVLQMNEYTEPISFVPMKSKNNTSLGAKDMSVFHDIMSATYE